MDNLSNRVFLYAATHDKQVDVGVGRCLYNAASAAGNVRGRGQLKVWLQCEDIFM